MAGTHTLGGILTAQTATFAVTAAQAEAAASVLGTIYVPNNAVIVDVILSCDVVIDDGAQATLDVGDSSGPETTDDNRFISGMSGQAVVAERWSDTNAQAPYAYVNSDAQVEQAIEITLQAVAATGAVGQLTLTVIYFAP